MKKRIVERGKRKIVRETFSYLKESLSFTYAVIGIFVFSAFMGFVFNQYLTFFDSLIESLVGQIEGLGLFGLIWFILKNNATASFFGFILGAVFGISPVINAITNGLLIGYVYQKTSAIAGYGSIWLLVPHGIFELPAIFISLALGLRLGTSFFAGRNNFRKEFLRRLKLGFLAFFLVVLPLLILAAIVEGMLIYLGRP